VFCSDGMPVGMILIAGNDVVTDWPSATVLPIIVPITFDVVSLSIAFVP
jgi:hypothetical protein